MNKLITKHWGKIQSLWIYTLHKTCNSNDNASNNILEPTREYHTLAQTISSNEVHKAYKQEAPTTEHHSLVENSLFNSSMLSNSHKATKMCVNQFSIMATSIRATKASEGQYGIQFLPLQNIMIQRTNEHGSTSPQYWTQRKRKRKEDTQQEKLIFSLCRSLKNWRRGRTRPNTPAEQSIPPIPCPTTAKTSKLEQSHHPNMSKWGTIWNSDFATVNHHDPKCSNFGGVRLWNPTSTLNMSRSNNN